MNQKIKYYLSDLEYCLSVHLRPSFLIVTCEDDSEEIYIILSCNQFRNKSIQKRIAIVFSLLSQYCHGIINEVLIVVTTLDGDEMEEYLDDLFTEELR
jgi:hypothetical protein